MANVSARSVESAKKVADKGAPELVAAVEAGNVAVSAAAEVASLPVEEQRQAVAEGKVATKAKEARESKKSERREQVAEATHLALRTKVEAMTWATSDAAYTQIAKSRRQREITEAQESDLLALHRERCDALRPASTDGETPAAWLSEMLAAYGSASNDVRRHIEGVFVGLSHGRETALRGGYDTFCQLMGERQVKP